MTSTTETPPPVNVRLHGHDTAGHLALIEFVVASHSGGPPLHIHPGHAEGFYVLEGELSVQVGERVVSGSAGSFQFAPPGTPHTFANFSDRDARMLVICTPAGFEAYFDELAAGRHAVPPADQAVTVGPRLTRPST